MPLLMKSHRIEPPDLSQSCPQVMEISKTKIWYNPDTKNCYDYHGKYLGKGVLEGNCLTIHPDTIEDTSFPYPELLFKAQ